MRLEQTKEFLSKFAKLLDEYDVKGVVGRQSLVLKIKNLQTFGEPYEIWSDLGNQFDANKINIILKDNIEHD